MGSSFGGLSQSIGLMAQSVNQARQNHPFPGTIKVAEGTVPLFPVSPTVMPKTQPCAAVVERLECQRDPSPLSSHVRKIYSGAFHVKATASSARARGFAYLGSAMSRLGFGENDIS